MRPYRYGHNHQIYLRQLGRIYAIYPETAKPLLAELEEVDRAIVTAEVALFRAERGQPFLSIAKLRAELFDE
jgi:hypothetical protein